MQDRAELVFLHGGFQRQQAAQLRVAVLFDDEQQRMRGEKFLDLLAEGKCPDTHVVQGHAFGFENVQRLAHRAVAAADGNDRRLVARGFDDRLRHQRLRALELALQAIEHDLVVVRVLGVAAVLVVTGAAREIRALRMHAGQRAVGDRVFVQIEIAVELGRQLFDLFLRQHLAAIRLVALVPVEDGTHPVVHADVEIRHHEYRRLQALGQIEGIDRHVEAFFRVRREQQHVARVAVRGIGRRHDVALLCPRRHARRGSDALDVEQHRGNLGVVGETDELVHQRNARAAGRREGARTVPGGADHGADGGEFILGLHDQVIVLARLRIDAPLLAEALERIHHRRRRRDRIPRADRRAGIETAECRRGVAIDQDVIRRPVHALHADRQRTLEMLACIVVADLQRLHVRVEQRFLAGVTLGQQRAHDVEIDLQQRGEHAGVHDVLEQDSRPHTLERLIAHARQRHAEKGDVVAFQQRRARPARVVDQIAAGIDFTHVARIRLRVHRHHEVDAARACDVAVARHADFVPRRQPLDVRGEVVLPHDGNAHAEHGLHQQRVGAGGAGSVDVRELDDEVV